MCLNNLKACWKQGSVVLDTTCPCIGNHQHPRTFSLLASAGIKADVRVVCAFVSPIMTQQVLQTPREQL